MDQFFQLLVAGLALGAIYALVALGFVVIYRSSQVFNFAQGELMTFGAFFMVYLTSDPSDPLHPGAGLPWAVALGLTLLGTGVLAAGIERGLLRPLVGRPVFVTIIITLLVGLVLRMLIPMLWERSTYAVPTPWETTAKVEILGAHVALSWIGAIVAGALALVAFFFVIRSTKLGVAMRATASDQEAALAQGIPVGRVFGSAWFIAGVFAALAGVFAGMYPRQHVDLNLGFVALRAFPAVIVGGLDSPVGAVIAGFALGVLEVMTQAYVSPELGQFGKDFHEVFPYLVMILFLMVRPYGLFGRKDVERV